MNHTTWITIISVSVVLSACGPKIDVTSPTEKSVSDMPPVGMQDEEGYVIKGRSVVIVRAGDSASRLLASLSGSKPVTAINAPSSSMTVSDAGFAVPSVSNALLDFGDLAVTALFDNNLKVCGPGGNQKCTEAVLRVYTTGTAGEGMWNSDESYGLPITATLSATEDVGLGPSGAAIMQTYTIAPSKKVMRLSDFSPAPVYNFDVDFTDAGAGSFSTTLVVEYALSL